MSAKDPQEICQPFQRYMAEGDIDAVLNLYDSEVVFLNRSGEMIVGREALREELARFASAKATFDFLIKQVIQSGDIALMHTQWKNASTQFEALVLWPASLNGARLHQRHP